MSRTPHVLRPTELDATTWPAWQEGLVAYEAAPPATPPRSYPGYPCWPLPRSRPRLWPALDTTLLRRRSVRAMGEALPSRSVLGRLLQMSHAATEATGQGPTPSAGSLQALELYLVHLAAPAWLPPGAYHYDRSGHHLSQIIEGADRAGWRARVPSLRLIDGGALLWLLVGDAARVRAKYTDRAERFLLLEAGHLMQNLCLMSASLGLATVPLGGVFECDVARALLLPDEDVVLYAGVAGRPC